MPLKIGSKHPDYPGLIEDWRLPMTLMAGTSGMRKSCSTYLPQWPKEQTADYERRVNGATLYNAFRRTVRTLSAKPFQKDVKVEDAPSDLEILETDVDRRSRTLTQFARREMWDLITYGLAYFMVDMPPFPEGTTRAMQEEKNIHPYFARIRPDEVVNWELATDETGATVLVELHIMQVEKVGARARRQRVVQWTPVLIQVWEREVDDLLDEKKEFVAVGPPTANPLGLIPLVEIYADSTFNGAMRATCPLEDLAFLNLRHFQSQSDQDTALHYARVPFLHFAGFSADEVAATIAANNAYASANPQSKIAWVEPTGAALEQGFKDLDRLEARMDVFGAELMVQRPGNETATAKVLDAGEKVSDLQSMAISMETALERGYYLAQKWLAPAAAPTEVNITLFREFGLSLKDAAEIDALLKSRTNGDISRETFLRELARRGIIDDLDPAEEKTRLAGEGAFDDDAPEPAPRAKGAAGA